MLAIVNDKLKSFNLSNEHKIIVSVSGGIDSMVLLHCLIKLDFKNISLIHFNYNIHSKAIQAAAHIEKIALINKFNYKIFQSIVPKNNFENNARIDRYKKLQLYAKKNKCDYILTAHHYDDQVETLIMNDLAKSDWLSYLGIREKYDNILRPMLTVYKKDLYNYAMYNKLLWFEDSTNKDLSFLRNNIRNKLSNHFYTKRYIKSLFELHSQAKIKLNKYLYFEFNFLRDMCKVKNNALIINGTIKDLSNPIYIKLFIKKIIKHNFNINVIKRKDYWKSLNDFFIKSIHGSKFVIDNNLILLSNRNEYIVYNKKDSSNQNNAKIISSTNWYDTFFVLDTKNSFKSNLILDVFKCPQEIINQGLYVTHWNRGDKMRINNKMTKKVSDIFINNKLSLYDKKIHPIIRNDKQEILWIPKLESGKFEEHNLANVYWINNER